MGTILKIAGGKYTETAGTILKHAKEGSIVFNSADDINYSAGRDITFGEYEAPEISNKYEKIVGFWWSTDKTGKKRIERARLEDTVYFHFKTIGIQEGTKIVFKLKEADFFFDDDEFEGNKVSLEGIVKGNRIMLELNLPSSWEQEVADDIFSNLELYWEWEYKGEVNSSRDKQLSVYFSNRTLYIKTPTPTHNLPEFISNDGDPMLLVEFTEGFALDQIKDKGLDMATKRAASNIKQIAFTKLKKGYMVDNYGKVYTGKRLIYEYKNIYSNSGELFEKMESGKNFGYNHGNGLRTTRGVSQLDYFAKNGKRVILLGAVKKTGRALDVFDILRFGMNDLDTSEPLSLPLGPLSPISDLAGILVQQQKAERDMFLEEDVQQEIDLAKLQGLEATRKAVKKWKYNEEFQWNLMAVSNETANKLLLGKFKYFDEFKNSADEDSTRFDNKIEILFREVYNENIVDYVYIIETIFIDE
ncbi:hypothetical protein ACFFU9_13385 [Mariniflexile ostreae]|uniref:Uncharacterized protein n=1 Tax=Mariniflexile ostreae TaxID=1520892 RepID=A0ABV5FEE5_9FLAO